MAQNHGAWAARRLWRHGLLVGLFLVATAMVYDGGEDRAQLYLLLVLPLLFLGGVLELQFFNDALARRNSAPDTLRDGRLLTGFFLRWGALLLLFGVLPLSATVIAMLVGGDPYPDSQAGRLLALIGAGAWWIGYALMGTVLPAFLSGRDGGLGTAIRRAGFSRRLRLVAPAGAVYLIGSLVSNEILEGDPDLLGGVAPGLISDLALIGAVTDLAVIFALALAARALTDHLLDEENLSEETARVFE